MNNNSNVILVAEDDQFLVKIYQVKLEKEGFKVVRALDGDEALEKMKEVKPGLVLLDIVMPKKSGVEVLGEMRNNPELKDIPVIVLSNLGQEEDMKKALDSGAVDYIVKANISIEEVIDKIKKHINRENKSEGEKATCKACGAPVPKGAKFCPNCGAKL